MTLHGQRVSGELLRNELRPIATQLVDELSRSQLIDSVLDLLEQAEYLHRARLAAWGDQAMVPLTIPKPPDPTRDPRPGDWGWRPNA